MVRDWSWGCDRREVVDCLKCITKNITLFMHYTCRYVSLFFYYEKNKKLILVWAKSNTFSANFQNLKKSEELSTQKIINLLEL